LQASLALNRLRQSERARYYGSALGRFTSPDWSAAPEAVPYSSLYDPQTLNLYTYVRNNPLAHPDPDGHCPICIAIAESPEGQEAGEWISENASQLVAGAGALFGAFVSGLDNGGHSMTTYGIGENTGLNAGKSLASANKPGTLGKPDHQQTVKEEADRISGKPEQAIPTPGGKKDTRRADAVGTNPETGSPEIVQVYRPQGKKGSIPKREKDAAADIEGATGIKPTMVPVRPLKVPCYGCSGPTPQQQ
jgi:RHS repeat-associated protein